jgi:hypothetical protein
MDGSTTTWRCDAMLPDVDLRTLGGIDLFTLRSRNRHRGHQIAEDLDEAVGRRLGAEGLLGEAPAHPSHGPALMLVVRGSTPEMARLVQRDIRTLEGTGNREASGSRTATRMSALAMAAGRSP